MIKNWADHDKSADAINAINGSRWISYLSVAQSSAEGILLDRPFERRSMWRRVAKMRLASWLAILAVILASVPARTSSDSDKGVTQVASATNQHGES